MKEKLKIAKRTIFKLGQAQSCHLNLVEEEEKEEKLDIKNKKINKLEAGILYIINFNIDNSGSLSWNLESNIEVFNAKLFVIKKAFKIAFKRINKFTKNIWVFSDSQAAIQRLQNCNLK